LLKILMEVNIIGIAKLVNMVRMTKELQQLLTEINTLEGKMYWAVVSGSLMLSDAQGWKDMSPEEYEKYDSIRRDTAQQMGNPDPGPSSQADRVTAAGQEERINAMRERMVSRRSAAAARR
jgi:hypothetical protein